MSIVKKVVDLKDLKPRRRMNWGVLTFFLLLVGFMAWLISVYGIKS